MAGGNDPGTFINNQDIQPDISMRTAPVDQPTLNPVAANTPLRYSPPAARKDDNLTELARGLSQFDSGLGRYMEERDRASAEQDKAAAQAAFVKNNSQGYADAVKAGAIPASASPTYVSAYKEAQGQLYGQQLEQKFQAAYDQWGGKNNLDDPDAYSKFAQDFFARNIATSDPDVLRGLMPTVHAIAEHGLRQHVEDQHQTVTQGFADTMSATVNNSISRAVGYANTSGNPLDPNWVAREIGTAYDKALSVGVKDEEAQKTAIIQITTAALLNKNGHGQEILQALDVPLPGTNLVLSKTVFGAEQKERIQNELDNYAREKTLREGTAQKAADKQALGVVEQRVVDGLVKDPNGPVSEDDLKEGSKYDPTFRVRVLDWQDKIYKNGGTSDPQGLMQLHRDIMAGAGMDSVTHAVELGVIRNPRDLKAAQDEVYEHQKAEPVMHGLTQSESYKAVMKSIEQQAAGGGASDPFGGMGVTPAALGVQYELNKRMQSWAAENPNATYNQTQDQLAKTAADVMKLIVTPKNTLGPGKVALPGDNPYGPLVGADQRGGPSPSSPTPSTTPQGPASSVSPQPSPSATGSIPGSGGAPQPATTGAAPGQATPSPAQSATASPTPPDPKAVQQWAATLSPADQAAVQRVAAKRGVDPSVVLTQAYQKAQAAGKIPTSVQPTPIPSATPVVPSGTSSPQPQYQPGAAEQFGDAVAKWQATDPRAPAIIHQFEGMLRGIHGSLPYQGSTTLAAIKDNPQAAHLLDFVAGPESGGNYNAYYGHGDNSKVNLTGMTLGEVLQFQHNLVAVDGQPSSAAGRYQFMPKTLQGLMGQLHLTGNERFTPELQDQLALQLLKNRGLEQWQQGKLDDATFANNLAYEWASLPNMHTGASQYGGDGLNKALVTPGQVSKVLGEARGLTSTATDPSVLAQTPAVAPVPGASNGLTLGSIANTIFGGGGASAHPPADMGVPAAPAPAPQANTDAKDFVIGDSVGDGVRSAMKAEGDTKVSRPPSEVLATIKNLKDGALVGRKNIVLSTGYSNRASESPDTVNQQIKALLSKGATASDIIVLGVGDRADFKANNINAKLQEAAEMHGCRFMPIAGQLPPGEHVHPDQRGYATLSQMIAKGSRFVTTGGEAPATSTADTED